MGKYRQQPVRTILQFLVTLPSRQETRHENRIDDWSTQTAPPARQGGSLWIIDGLCGDPDWHDRGTRTSCDFVAGATFGSFDGRTRLVWDGCGANGKFKFLAEDCHRRR